MMSITQVRLPSAMLNQLDELVEQGYYSNKSDVIRDALRKLMLERQIGSIPDSGDSVKEVRYIRRKLSKEKIDLNDINRM